MEVSVRKAGIFACFQWSKECLDFVSKICEKMEVRGFNRKDYYM
jgi:hypothetical protein